MTDIRNENHWLIENYRQRITRKQLKELLLAKEDTLIFRGILRQLVAKNLGANVYEIYKKPIQYNQE